MMFCLFLATGVLGQAVAQEADDDAQEGQTAAADAQYPEQEGLVAFPVTGGVGIPPVIVVPEGMEDGEYSVARDIITGNTLRLRVTDGDVAGAVFEPAAGTSITLEPIDPESEMCSTIHCSTIQAPTCFQLPGGGCACTCGAFQANPPN